MIKSGLLSFEVWGDLNMATATIRFTCGCVRKLAYGVNAIGIALKDTTGECYMCRNIYPGQDIRKRLIALADRIVYVAPLTRE